MPIRSATASDAPRIAELLGQLGYPAEATEIPARLARLTAGNGAVLLVVDASDVPIGLVSLQAFPTLHGPAPVAYITALVVAADARGGGVGRQLVAAAEAWGRMQGCGRLTVTSAEHRADAHAFYPAVGMPYTGRRFSRLLDNRSVTRGA